MPFLPKGILHNSIGQVCLEMRLLANIHTTTTLVHVRPSANDVVSGWVLATWDAPSSLIRREAAVAAAA